MTNIYCYCLFDGNGNFQGVYSSTAAVHRDAMKLCNKGHSPVLMERDGTGVTPTLTGLRNILKGAVDIQVIYAGGPHRARIVKTKLKE